jgi:hypothetical protein
VELDRLVLRALEKNPDARFQTVAEFRAELDRVAALLAQPAGWLDTTAFDPNAFDVGAPSLFDGEAQGRPATNEPVLLDHSAGRAIEPVDAPLGEQVPAAKTPMSARMLGLLFLIGVVLTTLVALAVATFVASR